MKEVLMGKDGAVRESWEGLWVTKGEAESGRGVGMRAANSAWELPRMVLRGKWPTHRQGQLASSDNS